MQSQKSAVGSLPEGLVLEHGSTSGDSGVIERQLCWTNFIQNPPPDTNQETRNLSMWNMGESSSHNASNGPYHNDHNVNVNSSNYASSSGSSVGTEARQLPFKRKADELSISQLSSRIEISNILQRPEASNSLQQSVSENPTPTNTMPFNSIIPRLGSGTGVSSDNRAMENIHRNVRMRINDSHQQHQSPASNSNSNSNNSSNNSSNAQLLNFSRPEGQPMLQVPTLSRNLHSSSRSRSSTSRADPNRPIASNISVGSGDGSRDHSLFLQPHDIRNAAQTAINLDLNTASGPTSLSSTSNPMPNLGPRRGSSLYPSRRRAELLRRALLSSSASGAAGGGGQTSNLFSRVPPPTHLRTSDRQLEGAFGFPYVLRRGRPVPEIRNVLDLIRRGQGLRFEDVTILDQSGFYRMPDIYDRHRDMRLDVDNMSYEELLALEERIGNVNTGLTEENIYKHLKQKTYAGVVGQSDDEPCCICQEEYNTGDDVGVLDCGHEFHTGCIKQWLLQKNSCPICKAAALK